ncbi:MAG: hypothetical protein IJ410_04400 [Oscillospiraceae bacterium]|nr:hypothetical protein [Oscillospiraceae bacterium]
MFALVALLCLYAGGNNIKKAFALAPFSRWEFINWALFGIGVLLLIVGVLCILQANKDLKERAAEAEKQQEAEKKKRQQEFFYDDEETAAAEETADNEPADL